MLQPSQIEDLMCLILSLERPALIEQLHTYPARFPTDFTAQYLESLSTDRLQHIFMALCVQNRRVPEAELNQAA